MTEQPDIIVVRQWKKRGHRSPLAVTTINISQENHARIKKFRDQTGMTYNELFTLAMNELEKKIVVSA